jgi:hypothetical protein
MSFTNLVPDIFKSSDIKNIKEHLDDEGFCVVEIKSIKLDHLRKLFEQDMARITGDEGCKFPQLWDAKLVPVPKPAYPGLMGEYGLSQGDSAWYVRTNPEIITLYKRLLDAEQVVCSMDAVGFTQDGHFPTTKDQLWLHVDQNPNVPGADLHSIQGIFYAEDCMEHRAGTVIVPGSHKVWNTHKFTSTSHFQIVDQERYMYDARKVDVPAGCLLLWNSKLVHQGFAGIHRLCLMVCYGNKRDRTEQARQGKVVMYLGGHRGNHWSQYAMYHGWKWQHGEPWEMLAPTLRAGVDSDQDDVQTMLEDEQTDPNCYTTEMDLLIPKDRLDLL